jgi:hypothetical protein
MRIRARFWGLGGVLTVGGVILLLTIFAGAASGKAQHVSWDIVSLKTAPLITFDPGGYAEAKTPAPAAFGPIETIRLTGSGTFVAPAGNSGGSGAVTGGGTWSINGGATSTYVVKELVSWEFANFQSPFPDIDNTGDIDERANGTAVLRIEFSDGQSGVLTVGCHGPGAPDHIFEGIATTKGFKTYYDVQLPASGVDANRTVFHVAG